MSQKLSFCQRFQAILIVIGFVYQSLWRSDNSMNFQDTGKKRSHDGGASQFPMSPCNLFGDEDSATCSLSHAHLPLKHTVRIQHRLGILFVLPKFPMLSSMVCPSHCAFASVPDASRSCADSSVLGSPSCGLAIVPLCGTLSSMMGGKEGLPPKSVVKWLISMD